VKEKGWTRGNKSSRNRQQRSRNEQSQCGRERRLLKERGGGTCRRREKAVRSAGSGGRKLREGEHFTEMKTTSGAGEKRGCDGERLSTAAAGRRKLVKKKGELLERGAPRANGENPLPGIKRQSSSGNGRRTEAQERGNTLSPQIRLQKEGHLRRENGRRQGSSIALIFLRAKKTEARSNRTRRRPSGEEKKSGVILLYRKNARGKRQG